MYSKRIKSLSNSKFSRIFILIAIISLLVIGLCRLSIFFLLENDFETQSAEFLYSVCYVLGFLSIFTFLISAIILIINLFRKNKN